MGGGGGGEDGGKGVGVGGGGGKRCSVRPFVRENWSTRFVTSDHIDIPGIRCCS